MKTRKEVNGMYFSEDTPAEVIEVIQKARHNGTRLRVYYGDIKTGKNWNEEYNIFGYIGKSTGGKPIPLLVYNSKSYGGGALLDGCIVKIKTSAGGKILYQHSKYQDPEINIVPSDLEDYKFNTVVDGKLYGRHKTLKDAENLKKKLS